MSWGDDHIFLCIYIYIYIHMHTLRERERERERERGGGAFQSKARAILEIRLLATAVQDCAVHGGAHCAVVGQEDWDRERHAKICTCKRVCISESSPVQIGIRLHVHV